MLKRFIDDRNRKCTKMYTPIKPCLADLRTPMQPCHSNMALKHNTRKLKKKIRLWASEQSVESQSCIGSIVAIVCAWYSRSPQSQEGISNVALLIANEIRHCLCGVCARGCGTAQLATWGRFWTDQGCPEGWDACHVSGGHSVDVALGGRMDVDIVDDCNETSAEVRAKVSSCEIKGIGRRYGFGCKIRVIVKVGTVILIVGVIRAVHFQWSKPCWEACLCPLCFGNGHYDLARGLWLGSDRRDHSHKGSPSCTSNCSGGENCRISNQGTCEVIDIVGTMRSSASDVI